MCCIITFMEEVRGVSCLCPFLVRQHVVVVTLTSEFRRDSHPLLQKT